MSAATWVASSRVGTSTSAAGRPPLVAALDERQPEGEGLAGSRRRLGEDVATRERVGNDELLDRERGCDLVLGESAHERRADAKRLECL